MGTYMSPEYFRALAETQATIALHAPTIEQCHLHAPIAARAFIHSLYRWRGPAIRPGDKR